ncbi:coiled-coil domain-containing protein 191 [Ambystoma mexicanum]|uniref:coiled-coil domain-containing protein 191 n=1 Tax=Ambystoma mexicanum TaxID=8296 RepID=UPI0037E71D6A
MLVRTTDMSYGKNKRPELYHWKRHTKKEGAKPSVDYDNVDHWIKRVEQASEFAVSEVFSSKTSNPRRRPLAPALDLESTAQLQDHDDAYAEAQDLLSDWMNSKLRLELASDDDDDDDAGKVDEENHLKEPTPGFLKYSRFDDLCGYLEQEVESTTVQDYMQRLLQKEVVDSGILEDLGIGEDQRKKRPKDPKLTMELRHQQVKENRAKRQERLERQRQDRTLKKMALSEAQRLLQEESRRKTLRAKKEEDDIQREVVRLRKDMAERRRVMEEARSIERRKQEIKNMQKQTGHSLVASSELHRQQEERVEREKHRKRRLEELLTRLHMEDQKCLKQHFSIWHKLVLERRIKMGKARALADWKGQLRVFRAWRDYSWARKLERETKEMETGLREENRKRQLASENDRRRLLRHCFVAWQLWCRSERDRRDLEAKKEETKRKMVALLDAASSSASQHRDSEMRVECGIIHNGAEALQEVDWAGAGDRTEPSLIRLDVKSNASSARDQPSRTPRHAWQVTRQHAALTAEELVLYKHQKQGPSLLPLDSHPLCSPVQRRPPITGEVFENRHAFQQQLLEEQRRQLVEQREMILELKENQRLIMLKKEAEQATAVTRALSQQNPRSKCTIKKDQDDPAMAGQSTVNNNVHLSSPAPSFGTDSASQVDSQSTLSSSRRTPGHPGSPHPMVKAMQERAAQRAERRRELEELRRKREEEKLAQLKAEEEERQRQEAAEKEAQLERRREERRQQKQKELDKQKRLERDQLFQLKAKEHHQIFLLKRRGLEPWKRLVEQAKQHMMRAEEHHCTVLQRKCLWAWVQSVRQSQCEKQACAEDLYRRLLLQRSLRSWLKYKNYLSILEERADRSFQASLKKKTFLAWSDLVNEEKIASWEKHRIAAEHSHRRIILTALRAWRRFPRAQKEEKLKEERREQLRKKVAEMLPDYRKSGIL